MNELTIVAVPGITMDATGALLRLVFVPRLRGPGTTLAEYGMGDWPSVVRDASVVVRLRTSSGTDLDPLTLPVHSEGRSEAWTAFFTGVGVVPATDPPTYADPVVAPHTDNAERISDAYKVVATAEPVADPAVVRDQLRQLDLGVQPAPAVPAARPEPTMPQQHFHRIVAFLREHPA